MSGAVGELAALIKSRAVEDPLSDDVLEIYAADLDRRGRTRAWPHPSVAAGP
ncbi:hypothetical protein [Asanoa ishikariensis]|uniref:hypothetical protein n=1 Tax=Asanoa ishikariensis TaxID=137265 RepID=UPI001EF1B15E|nr:hypothetical protein [Asanoa ishikariensis]